MSTTIINIKNERFALLPKREYEELVAQARGAKLPPLPAADKNGRYPAKDTIRAMIARDLITRRLAAGWTQEELAKRAKISVETISRLEGGKHKPQAATLEVIEAVFKKAGV